MKHILLALALVPSFGLAATGAQSIMDKLNNGGIYEVIGEGKDCNLSVHLNSFESASFDTPLYVVAELETAEELKIVSAVKVSEVDLSKNYLEFSLLRGTEYTNMTVYLNKEGTPLKAEGKGFDGWYGSGTCKIEKHRAE